jgi:hypothetical protein
LPLADSSELHRRREHRPAHVDPLVLTRIGVLENSKQSPPVFCSVTFFAHSSLFLLAAHFLRAGSKRLALAALAVAVLAGAPWAFEWSALAVPESIPGGVTSA